MVVIDMLEASLLRCRGKAKACPLASQFGAMEIVGFVEPGTVGMAVAFGPATETEGVASQIAGAVALGAAGVVFARKGLFAAASLVAKLEAAAVLVALAALADRLSLRHTTASGQHAEKEKEGSERASDS